MAKLLQRLQDPARSGVYRASRADPIADAVRGSKLSFAAVSLGNVKEKTELMRTIAAALGFPDWFGQNWDALEDCLIDMSWRQAQGHVLVFEAFQFVPADDLGVLIDVLISAAEYWAAQGEPFFAVFVDPERVLMLADLFREP
jgi:RNAse (barnase) inhibitor barstar